MLYLRYMLFAIFIIPTSVKHPANILNYGYVDLYMPIRVLKPPNFLSLFSIYVLPALFVLNCPFVPSFSRPLGRPPLVPILDTRVAGGGLGPGWPPPSIIAGQPQMQVVDLVVNLVVDPPTCIVVDQP